MASSVYLPQLSGYSFCRYEGRDTSFHHTCSTSVSRQVTPPWLCLEASFKGGRISCLPRRGWRPLSTCVLRTQQGQGTSALGTCQKPGDIRTCLHTDLLPNTSAHCWFLILFGGGGCPRGGGLMRETVPQVTRAVFSLGQA